MDDEKDPMFLDGNFVIVTRDWFNRVMSNYSVRAEGCPFCGSQREPTIDEKQGFYPRRGCLDCNRWWTKPELNGDRTV